MKTTLLLLCLSLCSCSTFAPLTTSYPQGQPNYGCIEGEYDYRDMSSHAQNIIGTSGNVQVQYIAGMIGYLLDFNNPRNHHCVNNTGY